MKKYQVIIFNNYSVKLINTYISIIEEKRRQLILQSQIQSKQQQQQQLQQQQQTDVFDFLNTTAGITYLESETNSMNKDNFIQSILLDSNTTKNTDNSNNRKNNITTNNNDNTKTTTTIGNNGMTILKIEDNEAKLRLKLVSSLLFSFLLLINNLLGKITTNIKKTNWKRLCKFH